MAKFRIDSIGQLARQMHFTPADARSLQVTAAEELLHTLDPARAYPLDFVIYRITGYHPKSVEDGLLTGLALQHDLGLLIEQVSEGLDLCCGRLAEPVLDIDDVCQKFNVTSKTIQRWRRRGLPARRFIFPDGKRRVGFLLSSVERFLAAHRTQVETTANISQVDEPELDSILTSARRLARGRCHVDEIARRIARRLNRSPLTILHTIRKFDTEHPDQAIFRQAPESLSARERAIVLEGLQRGLGLPALAQAVGRTRTAIYRILLEERLGRLNARRVHFHDDPLYHQPDAGSAVETIVRAEALADPPTREQLRVPKDLPPYLQALYRTPLLSAARERALFLKFNFHKFEFVAARRKLDPQSARTRDVDGLEEYLRRAQETKNAIVQANLRLVVSIARRHLRPGLSLMELISDGNLTLMRAVEGFDIHKGNRFSTYVTLALMKGFARSVPMMLSQRRGIVQNEQALAELPDGRVLPLMDQILEREDLRHMLGQLNDRERHVLSSHYGLTPDGQAVPFEELGLELGLSKQRIRQIEQGALAKLRAAADRE